MTLVTILATQRGTSAGSGAGQPMALSGIGIIRIKSARLLVEQFPIKGDHLSDVGALDISRKMGTPERLRRNRLHDRPQRQIVASGHQVDRGPHQRCAHRLALCDDRSKEVAAWMEDYRRFWDEN